MGFINTTYTDSVKAFTKTNIDLLNNPMYNFNDKKATIVDYYNKDINLSTLDEASGLEYDYIGEDCPSKFNLIEDAVIYGIEKIQSNYEHDEEYGVSASEITGEAFILPNTFTPNVGDFFVIKYLKEPILFMVTEIQIDTLDNGHNFWKIAYKDGPTGTEALKQIKTFNLAEKFKMLVNTVGTSRKSVIKSSEYDFLANIEGTTTALKEYYKQIFFKNQVQTFVYVLNGFHLYDPYLIEFMIRNKTLNGTRDYVYIDHATATHRTFGIDYDNTFFRALELKNKQKADKCNTLGVATKVNDIMSLLTTRLEDYYIIDYNVDNYAPFATKIEVVSNDFIDNILSGNTLSEKFPKLFKIILDYFNDNEFKEEDLDLLDDIEFLDSKDLFYYIPMIIYILERYTERLLERIDS